MTAYEIIYDKMLRIMVSSPIIKKSDMQRLAYEAVEEIREEFRKAGVDVWPRWKGGET